MDFITISEIYPIVGTFPEVRVNTWIKSVETILSAYRLCIDDNELWDCILALFVAHKAQMSSYSSLTMNNRIKEIEVEDEGNVIFQGTTSNKPISQHKSFWDGLELTEYGLELKDILLPIRYKMSIGFSTGGLDVSYAI
jgi:hypothetical protein